MEGSTGSRFNEEVGRLEKLGLASEAVTGSEVADESEVGVPNGAEGLEPDGSSVAEDTEDSVCFKAEEKEGLGSEGSEICEVVKDPEVPGTKVTNGPDESDKMEDSTDPEVVEGSGGRVRSDVADTSEMIGDRVADGAGDSEGLVKSTPGVAEVVKGSEVERDRDSPVSKSVDMSEEIENGGSEGTMDVADSVKLSVSDPTTGSETKEAIDDSGFGVAVGIGGSTVSEGPEADESRTFDPCARVSTAVGSSD